MFVLFNSSTATKNGNKVGITLFAQSFNPAFVAEILVLENKIKNTTNIKNNIAIKFFFNNFTIFITKFYACTF